MIGHNRTFGIPNFDIVILQVSLDVGIWQMVLSGFFRGYILISLDIGFWAFSQIFGYEISVLAILSGNGAILNKNIEFYSSISYTVIKDNQEPVRLKLHIGNIVDLNEESKVSGDELC
ncbi:hypothetical protein RhiirC2_858479 [Rhizophagus irregularis]|uniref:Uncharacterized protein n=1 Tax=Rhizophagus irregularis TaxID=588596 RepID=A0A2N1M517_9GLOM|nr:hypothetical protein RhiirC2_858479 [Rhizophagus irregularis]